MEKDRGDAGCHIIQAPAEDQSLRIITQSVKLGILVCSQDRMGTYLNEMDQAARDFPRKSVCPSTKLRLRGALHPALVDLAPQPDHCSISGPIKAIGRLGIFWVVKGRILFVRVPVVFLAQPVQVATDVKFIGWAIRRFFIDI